MWVLRGRPPLRGVFVGCGRAFRVSDGHPDEDWNMPVGATWFCDKTLACDDCYLMLNEAD